jgi:hypothetical protein
VRIPRKGKIVELTCNPLLRNWYGVGRQGTRVERRSSSPVPGFMYGVRSIFYRLSFCLLAKPPRLLNVNYDGRWIGPPANSIVEYCIDGFKQGCKSEVLGNMMIHLFLWKLRRSISHHGTLLNGVSTPPRASGSPVPGFMYGVRSILRLQTRLQVRSPGEYDDPPFSLEASKDVEGPLTKLKTIGRGSNPTPIMVHY